MNEWHLIETLAGDTPTVVSTGGVVKAWSSLSRLAPALTADVVALIAEVQRSRRRAVRLASSRKGRFRLEAFPVLGPSGDVHGIQLWIGEQGTPVAAPRIASGISWLLHRLVIAQTLEASMMSGVLPADHVPERTVAEYYAKAVKFDESESLFALALAPEHGRQWDADMSVLHADGRIMRWHCWGRGRTDGDDTGIRLLWHDVTDTEAPRKPTPAELGMQESMRTVGVYTAIVMTGPAVPAMWLPDAPPWVRWRNATGGNKVIHPDDHCLLHRAQEKFDAGDPTPVDVVARLSAGEDRWTASKVRILPYPGALSDRLAIVQVSEL
ncbi:GAF domain-containing protein [Rhodococcus gannanensis]|uniref:GAF domain-containing protein n=1 Tax=Rhodococcus gannanensis TaxID=1960308 RepID=A0ABW4P3B3_9NOCA